MDFETDSRSNSLMRLLERTHVNQLACLPPLLPEVCRRLGGFVSFGLLCTVLACLASPGVSGVNVVRTAWRAASDIRGKSVAVLPVVSKVPSGSASLFLEARNFGVGPPISACRPLATPVTSTWQATNVTPDEASKNRTCCRHCGEFVVCVCDLRMEELLFNNNPQRMDRKMDNVSCCLRPLDRPTLACNAPRGYPGVVLNASGIDSRRDHFIN